MVISFRPPLFTGEILWALMEEAFSCQARQEKEEWIALAFFASWREHKNLLFEMLGDEKLSV